MKSDKDKFDEARALGSGISRIDQTMARFDKMVSKGKAERKAYSSHYHLSGMMGRAI